MPINFFQREVKQTQARFNETFGKLETCDIKTRQAVILSIISMDRLSKKIMEAESKDMVRPEIAKFMRSKQALNGVFDVIEDILKERRQHADSKSTSKGQRDDEIRVHG